MTIESKLPDDETLILKPLRIPGTNMDTHRLQNASDLYGHGGDKAQQEGTDTTEDNYNSGRGVDHY